jgi:hypothetical protein
MRANGETLFLHFFYVFCFFRTMNPEFIFNGGSGGRERLF